jgi:N-carbamoyl-L-amino-acid hydrolase
MDEARALRDKQGVNLPAALEQHGIDFEKVKDCGKELEDAAAYLELHIEQGPVLLDLDLPLGTVLGTFGVERHAITFRGQAAHSGSTPMNRRRDAFLAAARMSPEIYRIAERSNGGVCTIGSCTTKPGIVTSVVEECRITLDQRHLDAKALARSRGENRERKIAQEGTSTFPRNDSGKSSQSFNADLLRCDKPSRRPARNPIACPQGRCMTPRVARSGVPQ